MSRPCRSRLVASGIAILTVATTTSCTTVRTSSGNSPTVPSTTTTVPVVSPSTTTTMPQARRDAIGTFGVGSTTTEFIEPGTAPGEPGRLLPTVIWYPTNAATGVSTPDRADGPYPLIVFSRGYDIALQPYQQLLTRWASAGYVIAAPTYPLTDPTQASTLDESDIVNHPADLRFVITSVLDMNKAPGTVVSGLIDPDEVAVAGHSDGADVTLAVAAGSCCRDPRVKAAAVWSGAELASFGGTYFPAGSAPLLVVQGSADQVNYPSCSSELYDGAPEPKYFLDLVGEGHLSPYVDTGADQDIVLRVTVDFFDAQLEGDTAAAGALAGDGTVAGISTLANTSSGPPAAGSCPGAPR